MRASSGRSVLPPTADGATSDGNQPVPAGRPAAADTVPPPDSRSGYRAPARLRSLVSVEGLFGLHPPVSPTVHLRHFVRRPSYWPQEPPELTLSFPGWTLPGVATAGATQTLLKSRHVPIGRRVVVAGTGPFLLPVAAALAEAGARVLVVEAARARSAPPGPAHPPAVPPQAEGGSRIRPGTGPSPGAGAHRLGRRPLRRRGPVSSGRYLPAWGRTGNGCLTRAGPSPPTQSASLTGSCPASSLRPSSARPSSTTLTS